jgi:hypothetical protein
VLGTLFVSDGERIGLARQRPEHLACESRDEAVEGKCRLKESACSQCTAEEDGSVSCQCQEWSVEEELDTRPLPQVVGSLQLSQRNGTVLAETAAAPVSVHLKTERFSLALKVAQVQCRVDGTLSGYYNWPGGAQFTHQCHSDGDPVLAEVGCGADYAEAVFTTRCDGKEAVTHLSLRSMDINWECRVSCPAGATTFQMVGSLLFRELPVTRGLSARGQEQVETVEGGWTEYLKQKWAELGTIDWVGLAYQVLVGPMGPLLLLAVALAAGGAWCAARANPVSKGYRLIATTVATATVWQGVEGECSGADEKFGGAEGAVLAAGVVLGAAFLYAALRLGRWSRRPGPKSGGNEELPWETIDLEAGKVSWGECPSPLGMQPYLASDSCAGQCGQDAEGCPVLRRFRERHPQLEATMGDFGERFRREYLDFLRDLAIGETHQSEPVQYLPGSAGVVPKIRVVFDASARSEEAGRSRRDDSPSTSTSDSDADSTTLGAAGKERRAAVAQLEGVAGDGETPQLGAARKTMQGGVSSLADAIEWTVRQRSVAAITILALLLTLPVETTAVRNNTGGQIGSSPICGIPTDYDSVEIPSPPNPLPVSDPEPSSSRLSQNPVHPHRDQVGNFLPGARFTLNGQQWEVEEVGLGPRGPTLRLVLVQPTPPLPPPVPARAPWERVERQMAGLQMCPPRLAHHVQAQQHQPPRQPAQPQQEQRSEADRANDRTHKRRDQRRRQKDKARWANADQKGLPWHALDYNSDTGSDDIGLSS